MGPLPPPQVRLSRGFPRLSLQKAGIAVDHVHVEHMFHGGMKTGVKGQHPLPCPEQQGCIVWKEQGNEGSSGASPMAQVKESTCQ